MKVQQHSAGRFFPTVARRRDIPASIRALDTLSSDYVDLFVAITADAADPSPERWARAALEDSSAVGRFIAWRALLGLQLGPQGSPEHLAGWKIVGEGGEWIRLEASSLFMTANIVFQVERDEVSFATLIRYDHPIAKLVWTPVSAIHRQIAPEVLRGAVRRIQHPR